MRQRSETSFEQTGLELSSGRPTEDVGYTVSGPGVRGSRGSDLGVINTDEIERMRRLEIPPGQST